MIITTHFTCRLVRWAGLVVIVLALRAIFYIYLLVIIKDKLFKLFLFSIIMNDKNFFITGGAGMTKSLTGYSNLLFTDMSRKMNELYGIDEIVVEMYTGRCPQDAYLGKVCVPMTEETARKLRGASIMNIASHHEANPVIHHFLEMTAKLGQFAAVLYEEVAGASNISQYHIDIAIRESVFRISETDRLDGKIRRIMELNTNLIPVTAELPKELYSRK